MTSAVQLRHFLCSLVCVLFVFSCLTSAETDIDYFFDCETTIGDHYYNLNALTVRQMNGTDTPVGTPPTPKWWFYMTMCNVGPYCHEDGAMACQRPYGNTNQIIAVALPNDNMGKHNWTEIPGGIQLIAYGEGHFCQAAGDRRVSVVQVMCNQSITAAPLAFDSYVVEDPVCTYTFRVAHISGCPLPVPPKPAGPSCDTEQSKVTAAGFFTGGIVSAVIVVGGFFTYQWYKKRSEGASGASSSNKWTKLGGGGDKSVNLTSTEHESDM